jgi:hypothetical protein
MAETKVIEQVAELSTKKAGRPKRKPISSVPIQQTCKECGVSYQANNVTMDDKTTLITPPRCDACQTEHVVDGRVNKAITAFKHIGNCKPRLTKKQRDAITMVLGNELQVLLDVFAGNSISTSGFSLKNVSA